MPLARPDLLFGLTTEEVAALRATGYHPRRYCEGDVELRRALDALGGGAPLVDSLLYDDRYTLLADYRPCVDCLAAAGRAFLETERWMRRPSSTAPAAAPSPPTAPFGSTARTSGWRAPPVPTVPWRGTPRVPATSGGCAGRAGKGREPRA